MLNPYWIAGRECAGDQAGCAVGLGGPGRHDTPDASPVQSGQPTTSPSARRIEVLRLLSNVDTAHLTDREIARRTGVSPQTVGDLRRKQAAEPH